MFALFKKEINGFFSTPVGFLIIAVFLLSNSLLMWGFSSDYNILDNGYAHMDSLFILAPILFLLFIPAVTMRLFADEHKEGTIELILTKPLTELQIVLAKYFAGLILVILSILPTLVHYFSIYSLGETNGNLDSAGIFGSYIGLFFLASGFVAIGTFSSAISKNQIISFIIAIIISAFFYLGWDIIASGISNGKVELTIQYIGINAHYLSLSKGVIDTRDILYFISLNTLFVLLTQTILASRKWE
ncbi:MAG: gliding motility-associated ABC transporter permease subunit GldF [Flavobacteriales bacterium]|nr:gliding motility-associated ABC transporter permease subunit GldF [Flavobacteriales bacterium]|tara:strand:+ start:11436 stop:12170 length:735 start_codon:yes stop_codon:yes gene_type:complete